MANYPGETSYDDFLEQLLRFQGYAGGTDAGMVANEAPMMLQLGSGDDSAHLGGVAGLGVGIGGGYGVGSGAWGFPLGLSLERGKGGYNEASGSGKRFHRDDVESRTSSIKAGYPVLPMANTVPAAAHPPAIRPRVRARRGQATDPHSIAERTDRAAMLDEIVDYVKFLRLQVKVLSMSRLGRTGADRDRRAHIISRGRRR